MREFRARNVISMVAVAVLATGCFLFATTPKGPTIKTWLETTPSINFQSPVEQGGLVIEVTPIDEGNVEKFPRIMGDVDYNMYAKDGSLLKQGTADFSVFGDPPLAFQLKITNKTGHVIRFTGAVIKLIDAAGNIYDALSKEDLEAEWMGWNMKELENGIEVTDATRMWTMAKKVKLLGPNTEILPDYTTEVYVGFDPHMAWSSTFDQAVAELKSLEQVKLALYEVVTETDDAGNPVSKEKFEWSFDIVEKQEEVD